MQLDGKRIVLTGAASGIGRSLLQRLTAYPCRVLAVDRDAPRLAEALRTLPATSTEIAGHIADVGSAEAVHGIFDEAVSAFGGVDIFIANAGYASYGPCEPADWQAMEALYRVNVFSPTYAALKMRESCGDRDYKVVITASAQALLGIPGYALYAGTKAALHGFADVYRLELADRSRLMLVYPIGTRTGFFNRPSGRDAPMPWPTQSADKVAQAIIRGIETDSRTVIPSMLFRLVLELNRFLPLGRLEQWLEVRRFRQWQIADKADQDR